MTTWGILWDLDGVLVDTGALHFQTWTQVFAELGQDFDFGMFRRTFGMKNAEILPLWLGRSMESEEIARISDLKETKFRQAARGHVEALPGVRKWLEYFRTEGYRQAVASSASEENIEALVDELAIRRYFLALVSASALPGKPDPAVFVEAARRIDVPPARCIVVEDSVAGVEAARRAGMKCIAVTTTHPAADLGAASLIVEHMDTFSEKQLRAWLDG
jgi:HAD superfamily hydrolase (TIGR01509 family)